MVEVTTEEKKPQEVELDTEEVKEEKRKLLEIYR